MYRAKQIGSNKIVQGACLDLVNRRIYSSYYDIDNETIEKLGRYDEKNFKPVWIKIEPKHKSVNGGEKMNKKTFLKKHTKLIEKKEKIETEIYELSKTYSKELFYKFLDDMDAYRLKIDNTNFTQKMCDFIKNYDTKDTKYSIDRFILDPIFYEKDRDVSFRFTCYEYECFFIEWTDKRRDSLERLQNV